MWVIIGELNPCGYSVMVIGIATSSNQIWNFLLAFFTPFITTAIDDRYGYLLAPCNFLGSVAVYFFLCETRGRILEEIDTMYILHVDPRKNARWEAREGEKLVVVDKLALTPDAGGIRKERPDAPDSM
jgi:SP family sugar:H+ symporter-like MFS transporter